MERVVQKKSVVLIVLIFLFVIVAIGCLFYLNLHRHAIVTIEAVVESAGDHSIVVVSEDNQKYSLTTQEVYQVGDRLSIILKDIDDKVSPKEATVVKIDMLSRTVQFSIIDSSDDIVNDKGMEENGQNENLDSSVGDVSQKEEVVEPVAYFSQLNRNLEQYQSDSSWQDEVKKGFITIVDFLFYDGEIGGKNFSSLSEEAKLKVLKLALSIDQKIEAYFPSYKESLSASGKKIYMNVKQKVLEIYLDTTTAICEKNQDLCVSAKEGLADLKKSFSLTWDFVKEISGAGVSKLKSWYEIWRSSND